ncbi:MAG: translation elongation factor Ts [Clostridiales bacterium]|nr:translation elongation factor Ts [Clostridiales bacterium]
MAQITAKAVNDLRIKMGVGLMDCKRALVEADGDEEKAIKILREKGLATAAKKQSRIAAEGIVESYIHMGGKIGVLLEVNCETDFVAKTDAFKQLVHNIAMHIAAANPAYLNRDEVPADVIEKEKEIIRAQALNEGKKEAFVDKIIEGRINKFYKENCLMEQQYMLDPDMTIEQIVTEAIAKIGEKITVRRYTRYAMGEGLEKRQDNFAEEVMSQMG